MNEQVRTAIANRMNRLTMVRWDRCVIHDSSAVAYGWIKRAEKSPDFVLLDFQWGDTLGTASEPLLWFAVGIATSSVKHSAAMSEALNPGSEGHKDCERIEDVFGDLIARRLRS